MTFAAGWRLRESYPSALHSHWGFGGLVSGDPASATHFTATNGLNKERIAQLLGIDAKASRFPSEIEVDSQKAVVQYTFDAALQETMESLMKSYSPDHGAFVAMDADTGRILSMVSYSRDPKLKNENLALRASFPSASVFKVVTAAAAIETQNFHSETVIPYSGRAHTLYKHAVFETRQNRWTHQVTLRSAFANSINTVFGKVGALMVGATELKDYASRFGFNRAIASDLPMQQGQALIPEDAWGISEAASGYTVNNTMSPLQGAMMASAIARDGVMMEPFAVQSINRQDGTPMYQAEPRVAGNTVDAKTAAELRELMRETVSHGTARKSFRGFSRGGMSLVDVGGKTGSLTGMDPPGKYDWFVGYAMHNGKRIAFASLTIHEKFWRVKSAYLARRAIESYFRAETRSSSLPGKNVAVNF